MIAGGLRSRLRPVAALVFAIAAALWVSGAYARQELVSGLGAGVSRAEGFESDLRHRAFVERRAAIVAKVLREEDREDLLVAASGIGAVGYLSGGRILDIFGLVDPRIARTPSDRSAFPVPGHLRSDAGYVFSLAPDYILVPRKGPGGLRLPAIVDIWEHPEFDSHYEWVPAIRGYRRKQP